MPDFSVKNNRFTLLEAKGTVSPEKGMELSDIKLVYTFTDPAILDERVGTDVKTLARVKIPDDTAIQQMLLNTAAIYGSIKRWKEKDSKAMDQILSLAEVKEVANIPTVDMMYVEKDEESVWIIVRQGTIVMTLDDAYEIHEGMEKQAQREKIMGKDMQMSPQQLEAMLKQQQGQKPQNTTKSGIILK